MLHHSVGVLGSAGQAGSSHGLAHVAELLVGQGQLEFCGRVGILVVQDLLAGGQQQVAALGRGVKKLKVVYSKEQPIAPKGIAAEDGSGNTDMRTGTARRSTPGSNAFVPSVAGLIIGGEVIKDLIKLKTK